MVKMTTSVTPKLRAKSARVDVSNNINFTLLTSSHYGLQDSNCQRFGWRQR